tara:strand:+ start:896 stop:1339 length:444 start_codon:yes stop_codon:yes gene_type:complete
MPYRKELHQGKFIPKNPKKYKGNIRDITYRSGYELKFMNWADLNADVVEWASESVVIPYRSPLDRKVHRYYVDFYLKTIGGIYLIEIKPERFTKPPPPRKKTKRYLEEVAQYGINEAKWKSAQEFCADRGWQFKIITEKELGIYAKV